MKAPRWSPIAASLRAIQPRSPFWAAAFLSIVAHSGVFAAAFFFLLENRAHSSSSLPILAVQWGDADREGLAVDSVALDPGTLRQGDADTPGGDGAKKPADDKPPVPAPPAPPPPSAAPAPIEKPADTPGVVALPNPVVSAPAPPTNARPGPNGTSASGDPALPGAPGGSHLPPGTPSAGGKTVGSVTGVRLGDAARPPVYPPEAREEGMEGTPVIWLRVSADGDVLEARVYKSCGHKVLDDAALHWARSQKFIPAYHDGVPVEAEVTKPIRYYLY